MCKVAAEGEVYVQYTSATTQNACSRSQPHSHLLSIVVEAVLTSDRQPAVENEELW